MGHNGVDRLLTQNRVPVSNGRDGAMLHRDHRFPLIPGECDGAGMALDHLPEGILGQGLQAAAGPIAVPALRHTLVEMHRDRSVLEDQRGGLLRPFQRRRNEGLDRDTGEPIGKLGALLYTAFI